MTRATRLRLLGFVLSFLVTGALAPRPAPAHCDTLDGPVVQDARKALDKGDVAPVMKWIPLADEPLVREAFARTLRVRGLGGDARDLADQAFFETLVRIHRAGEGAPYEGLRPAGATSPILVAADEALASGSTDEIARELSEAAAKGVRERFEVVKEAKAHAQQGVDAGRIYVAAYIDYVHFVEALHGLVAQEHAEHAEHAPEHAPAGAGCGHVHP